MTQSTPDDPKIGEFCTSFFFVFQIPAIEDVGIQPPLTHVIVAS